MQSVPTLLSGVHKIETLKIHTMKTIKNYPRQVREWIKLYERNDPSKNTIEKCERIQVEMDNIEAFLTTKEKEMISDYYGCQMFEYENS